MRPPISLCMILRDSEASIRRCLNSAKGLYDELVVVMDSRSADATEAIVRDEYGAKVTRLDWCGFDGMRNESIRQASNEWCLVLDGDERIGDRGDVADALDALGQGYPCDAVFVSVVSVNERDEAIEEDRQLRIFRRSQCRYVFPVHNQLRGYRKDRIGACTLQIRATYPDDLTGRAERALPALEKLLAESPPGSEGEIHARYYLARTFGMVNRHAEAIPHARRVVELRPDHVGFCSAWVVLARATFAKDGAEAGAAVVREAISHHESYADLWWWLMVYACDRWRLYATAPGRHAQTPQLSIQYLPNAEEAMRALGVHFRPLERREPAGATT